MLVGNEDDTTNQDERNVPAAVTDTGCERELNEDRYAVIDSPSGLAWLVCDGMGGSTGGELAAQIAIEAMRRDLESLPARSPEAALRSALLEANRVIVLRRQNQAFAQMGTTVVGAIFSGPEVVFGHVGDSRAYLIRSGEIQQITTDHTYVQQLVDKGQIKPEEALSHPQAHVLTRAIGAEPGVDPEIHRFWIWDTNQSEPNDILMLCTDGLYSLISEQELANAIYQDAPQNACVNLVELAKSRGGFDNITLAIIPITGQLRSEPPPGFDPELQMRNRAKRSQMEEEPTNYVKLFGMILVLCVMASMLVVFIMMFSLGR